VPRPLADAFSIGSREVVTIVGGGGKTTALFRLARELHERASSPGVIVTTTTHILVPPPAPDLETVLAADAEAGLSGCRAALARGCLPVLGARVTEDGRLAGVAPELVDSLAAHEDIHYIVVEADGSARKPFKAPLAYEPVVPSSTTLLIAVVGVDALGKPLEAEYIHRPQRVAELSGARLGEPLQADAIAAVLVHPAGPLRDAPEGARVLVLLNKADTDERRAAARTIAASIQASNGPPTLIGAVAAERPFSPA
jgi:molybdenum cofactor cytidylyltransferase